MKNINDALDQPLVSFESTTVTVGFALLSIFILVGGLLFLPKSLGLTATVFGILLIAISYFDLRTFRIPNMCVLMLFLTGSVPLIGQAPYANANAGLGVLIGSGLFFALRSFYKHVKGIPALGWGDVKLAAALGLWIGATGLPYVLLIASVSGLLVALTTKRALVPFAPFLCFGAWISFVWVHGHEAVVNGLEAEASILRNVTPDVTLNKNHLFK